MNKRSVLITGAGGFVGRALTRGFADLGWQVTGLDRAFDGEWDDDIHRVEVELADGIPKTVPRVDLVVHAAWVTTDPGTFGIPRAAYSAMNFRPLLAVLKYTARTHPAAFVFLSSSGVFAPRDATEGLTDTDHPTGTSPYALAKRAAELMVRGAIDRHTAVHLVRLGYLYGPDEAARYTRARVSLVAGWTAAIRAGRPLEIRTDDPARDWTFTSDLAGALERVVDGPPTGHPVHVGSAHVLRDRAFAGLLASRFPGTETVTVAAHGRVKAPMVPSDIAGLRGYPWTDPSTGLDILLAAAGMV